MAFRKGYGASDDADDYSDIYRGLTGNRLSNAQLPQEYDPKNVDGDIAASFAGYDDSPVQLTETPTSSTDASRPRTVAAGYREYAGSRKGGQAGLGKMTVMFRDGTLYNYYDVTPGEWQNFRASISKGSPWLNKGFPNGKQQVDGLFINKPRGPANMANVDPDVLESIYLVAREAQVRFSNKRTTTVKGISATGLSTTLIAPRKVRANAKQKMQSATKAKNPSKNNGKNPYQK